MPLRSYAIALILSFGAVAGCYKPNLVVQGGFRCSDAGACPENFKCLDGLCYTGDAGPRPDVGVPPVCMFPPPAPTCSRDPGATQACSPSCLSGCSCGWCAVVNGAAKCITGTPGTKVAGDVCDPSSATDCAPGLFCKSECGTGHCYKHCDSSSDCPVVGTACTVNGPTGVKLCSLPPTPCDAITNTGCRPGFACYFTGGGTTCDCPGTTPMNGGCTFVVQCMPGYSCAGHGGDAGNACVKLCRAGASCPSPSACTLVGEYGYCL